VVLTDQGICRSKEFRDYVTKDLLAQSVLTSTYYPQGNGINEASHKGLDYHVMSSTWESMITDADTFDVLVQEAVLIHNALPNTTTGEAPAMLLMGDRPDSAWVEAIQRA
jgi:transposase InsO family protein